MINVKKFIKELKKNNINFYTGVPDSLLKEICNEFDKKNSSQHILASNEGSAVGIAIGYNLAKDKVPLVYLQNSGLGNIVNPVMSLSHKKVFKTPIFFLIGWRGEVRGSSQIHDEPQHLSQGKATIDLLKLLNIKFKILDANSNFSKIIKELHNYAKDNNTAVALLVRKNSFIKTKKEYFQNKSGHKNYLSRENVIKIINENAPKKIPKISTTGMTSRELYEINVNEDNIESTFMCVGGMGHSLAIATGIANFKKNKKIICVDGDGSLLMHSGIMSISAKSKNLIHILLNNGVHDSVGGQRTPSENIEFYKLAREFGYHYAFKASSKKEIISKLKSSLNKNGSVFIEIVCKKGHKSNLLRPLEKPEYYKKKFKNFLKK